MRGQLYNAASVNLEYDTIEPLCNRAKLDTGTLCNYRCGFCYYFDKLTELTPIDTIKARVDYLIKCGITEVDLSGGESSVHPNWFDILDYCSERKLHISTLSNGYKFADVEFMRRSQHKGLREILFSLHGYDKDSHNTLVGNKHGYDKIIQAIKNAHSLGITVRINCTVTHDNYEFLPTKFADLIRELQPFEVNFLTLNYWGDAHNQQHIDYALVTPAIHRAIDNMREYIPVINVRYTPYCFMVGYEQYVCNYYQHIYDVFDWNIAVYDGTLNPEEYNNNKIAHLYNAAKRNRLHTYYKKPECVGCKYYFLCDGVEKQITDVNLLPVAGERITQVNFFRKGWYSGHNSNKWRDRVSRNVGV